MPLDDTESRVYAVTYALRAKGLHEQLPIERVEAIARQAVGIADTGVREKLRRMQSEIDEHERVIRQLRESRRYVPEAVTMHAQYLLNAIEHGTVESVLKEAAALRAALKEARS